MTRSSSIVNLTFALTVLLAVSGCDQQQNAPAPTAAPAPKSAAAQTASAPAPATNAPIAIKAADAMSHTNEIALVSGKVVSVNVRPSVIVLSFDKPGTNAPFTAVVFSRATNKFGNLTNLQGKDVTVKGKIKIYRGKPEIILDAPGQLTVGAPTPPP